MHFWKILGQNPTSSGTIHPTQENDMCIHITHIYTLHVMTFDKTFKIQVPISGQCCIACLVDHRLYRVTYCNGKGGGELV